jgi:hypothetical protein
VEFAAKHAKFVNNWQQLRWSELPLHSGVPAPLIMARCLRGEGYSWWHMVATVDKMASNS